MSTNKFNFLKNDFASDENSVKKSKNQERELPSSSQNSFSDTPAASITTVSTATKAKKTPTSTTKTTKTQSRQKIESGTKTKTQKKSRKSQTLSTTAKMEEKIGKRSDPNYKTVGVLLPKQAHKKAKILLMDDEQERDFSALMTQLLEKWLEEPDC